MNQLLTTILAQASPSTTKPLIAAFIAIILLCGIRVLWTYFSIDRARELYKRKKKN